MVVSVNVCKLRKTFCSHKTREKQRAFISLWPSGASQDPEAGGKAELPPFAQVLCGFSQLRAQEQEREGDTVVSGKEKGDVPSPHFSPACKVQLSPN